MAESFQRNSLVLGTQNVSMSDRNRYPVYVKDSNSKDYRITNGSVYSNGFAEWINANITTASDFINNDLLPESSCANVVNDSLNFVNNKFLKWVGNVKETISGLLSSKKIDNVGSWICKQASTTFEALLVIIKALIYFPLVILRLLKALVHRILELLESAVSKIFKCIDSMIETLFKRLSSVSIADLFTSLKQLLIACDYVAKPVLWMMNNTFEQVLPPLRNSVGLIDNVLKARSTPDNPSGEEFNFRSSRDAIVFLNTIISVFEQDKSKLLNSSAVMSVLSSYNKMKRNMYDAIKKFINTIMAPFFILEQKYNDILNTRSRFLGKWIVNPLIGWLLPDYSVTNERIYRSRYSIIDLLKIAEGMTKCSSYVCKANAEYNRRKLELIYDKLCIGKNGRWFNPFQIMKTTKSFLSRSLDKNYVEDSVQSTDYLISSVMNSSIDTLINSNNLSGGIDKAASQSSVDRKNNIVSSNIKDSQSTDINANTNAMMSDLMMYRQISVDQYNLKHNEYFDRYRSKEIFNKLSRTISTNKNISNIEEDILRNLNPNEEYISYKQVYDKVIEGKNVYSDVKKYAVERAIVRIEEYNYKLAKNVGILSTLGVLNSTNIIGILSKNRLLIRQFKTLENLLIYVNNINSDISTLKNKIKLENIKLRFLISEKNRFSVK